MTSLIPISILVVIVRKRHETKLKELDTLATLGVGGAIVIGRDLLLENIAIQ